MRPVRLTIEAFGPYADVQVLRFDELGDRQLFLINGPTGAGKTAILDAMCYALYGDTSGNERDARQMRSDHANPATATGVTLDFALGDQIYRVTRSPEQERTKLRGTGLTQQPARATLWKRTGCADNDEGHVLADKTLQVTEAIQRLTGFTVAEFRQVVVLPQGQFQRLLTSGSDGREQVLETLFRTEHYRLIQEALRDARKRLEQEAAEHRGARELLLGQAEVASVQALEAAHRRCQEDKAALRERLGGLRVAKEDAHRRHDSAKKTVLLLEELEHAEVALVRLALDREANDARRAKLARARKAFPLVEVLRARDQAQVEAGLAREACLAAAARLNEAQTALDAAQGALARQEARKDERSAAVAEVERMRSLAGRSEARTKAASELEKARARQNKLAKAVKKASQSLTALERRERDLVARLQAGRGLAAQIDTLAAAVRHAEKARAGSHQLRAAEKMVAKLTASFTSARKALLQQERLASRSRSTLERLEAAWRAGQAGVFARNLQAGKPCPVCGSTRHPAPATAMKKVPHEEALEHQREEARATEASLSQCKEQVASVAQDLAAARARVETLQQQLGDDAGASPKALETALRRTAKKFDGAQQAAKGLSGLKKDHGELLNRLEAERHVLQDLEGDRERTRSQVSTAQAALDQADKELPPDLRDPAALAQATREVQARSAHLEKMLTDARAQRDRAATAQATAASQLEGLKEREQRAAPQLEAHQLRLRDCLAKADFRDEGVLRDSVMSEALVDAVEGQVRDFDSRMADGTGRVERARQAAAGLEMPDLESLARSEVEAEGAITESVREEERLGGLLRSSAQLLERLRTIEKSLEGLEKRHTVVGRIAEIADGRNARGVPFHRFVLASLLDDVLREASSRLRIMSNSRYTLVRGSAQRDRRSTTGLELEVFDAYTGATRPVVTLSGGESFLASLSLALGLADVVQAYAGGIRLDAVFVDEGFGSLDPESLDLALRALVDLQKGGRLVGIISHVPELKERIGARLEVTPSQRGSRARFVLDA